MKESRVVIKLLSVCLLVMCIVNKRATAQHEQPKMNVVLILADDLGWGELGCYGNNFNETPHLDRLAKEGMRFNNGYAAAPVCSPTRAALLSGQYPARLNIIDYLGPHEPDKYFNPDLTTLNEVFSGQGYITGLVGKWHLTGDYKLKRGAPAKHGWDEIICTETTYIGNGDYYAPYLFMPEVQSRLKDEYLTDRLTDEAISFISRHRERPFFLYLSHYAVHTKLDAKPESREKYVNKDGAGTDRNNPELAGMIETLDAGVGRIMGILEDLKIDDHTIIVFTSDNGGETRVTTNGLLRSGKSFLYEGGIRVPLIVKWPGTVMGGSIADVPVITQDLYPTLREISGARGRSAQRVDGLSLINVLRGRKDLKRDALYWHYPLKKPHFLGGTSAGAVRWKNYKLIEFFDTGKIELYDLARDPSELIDLAGSEPELASQMKAKLLRWRESVDAEMYHKIE